MTRYYGLRDWEWMIRTAAQPAIPEDPYDEFADIWRGHQGRGTENRAAQDWLDQQVNYQRVPGSSSPHAWVGTPGEDYRYRTTEGEPQWSEANRTIDDSHAEFNRAYQRGLENDYGDPGQFNPGGQAEPEPWNPTSEERLRSDEGWLLGPNRTFNWPGGRDQYAQMHNGMHSRGFELDDESPAGTEQGSPVYVHRQTGARIRPELGEGEPTGDWVMTSPGGGSTTHSSPASAAMAHQTKMDEQAQREAEAYQRQSERYRMEDEDRARRNRDYDDYGDNYGRNAPRRNRGGGGGSYRREAPDYIPKTKAQKMHWRDLFHEAIHGNEGQGREFERASVKSVHNPFRGATGRLYGVHQDQWDQDFTNDAAGRGKVSQAIYHYATPIAWKYHQVQPDGTYDEGTWRFPATSFGSGGFFSTGRVQGLMGPAFYHGGPGAPSYGHTRDPLISHHTHRAYEDAGIHRQDDQTYRAIDNFGNEHYIAPSQSGQTVMHTITDPTGRTFKKRITPGQAGENAYEMMQTPGAGGPSDPVAYLRAKGYRDSQPAPRQPRREVPLRLQPELPGMPPLRRSTSHADILGWSENLRS